MTKPLLYKSIPPYRRTASNTLGNSKKVPDGLKTRKITANKIGVKYRTLGILRLHTIKYYPQTEGDSRAGQNKGVCKLPIRV